MWNSCKWDPRIKPIEPYLCQVAPSSVKERSSNKRRKSVCKATWRCCWGAVLLHKLFCGHNYRCCIHVVSVISNWYPINIQLISNSIFNRPMISIPSRIGNTSTATPSSSCREAACSGLVNAANVSEGLNDFQRLQVEDSIVGNSGLTCLP